MFMDFPMGFSDRLREVPGEVHHDGNGGEEADDAGGVVEGMFLRATGVERWYHDISDFRCLRVKWWEWCEMSYVV